MEKATRKLRVGVMTNGTSVPDWAYKMLEAVVEQGHAEIVLHIQNGSVTRNGESVINKIWRKRANLAYLLYEAMDQKLFSLSPDAFLNRSLSDLMANVPKVTMIPIEKKFTDRFEDEDIQTIKEHKPDLLIRLGFRILTGEILTAAPQGVWSYHHADNRVNRGGPAGFWEFVKNDGVTGITLQKLTESLDDGVVVARSATSTNRFSYGRNRNALYWRSSFILSRKIASLARLGPDAFWKELSEKAAEANNPVGPILLAPKNWEFLKLITAKLFGIHIERISFVFRVKQWILLSKIETGSERSMDFRTYQRLIPNRKKIWADPFPVIRNGEKAVFFEEQSQDSEIGYIVGAKIFEDGTIGDPVPVVRDEKHASFPFIFEFKHELYMIPETGRTGSTSLYKCDDFPFKWSHDSKIMDGTMMMDTVLFEQKGTWYMFCTMVEPEGSSSWDELHLYHSDNPLTDSWIRHPVSPVVSDPTNGRMAGKLFYKNGQLHRPGQNSSGHYGAGMTISRVDVLSKTEYRESPVESIEANWANDLHGTHTINSIDGLTMIDAQIKRFRWF